MATSGNPERSTIDAKHKWDTTHLFSSDDAWTEARAELMTDLERFGQLRGTLEQGGEAVLTCLQRMFDVNRRLARLVNYAHRNHDQDTRVSTYQGLKGLADRTITEYSKAISFVRPELLSLPEQRLTAMVDDPVFAEFSQYLREIVRQKPHILSPPEEAILAAASQMRDSGYHVYSSFCGADMTFPEITDEKGDKVRLSQAQFGRFRGCPVRKVRRAAFEGFFGAFASFRTTLAALLSSQLQANVTYARARRYDSALSAALDTNHLPTSVYHSMIEAIHHHLPLMHRYLGLRRKLLGLRKLRYFDLYVPMVEKVDLSFSYDDGCELLLAALEPMGEEYVSALARGLNPKNGWVDVFPNAGKRSGAYMDGSAYDVHPYVLCNFIGDYNSVSTVAHEMGHAMHSYFSNKTQPYAISDYSIFVAEVASTFNEALLMEHLLAHETDPRRRMFLLGERLESFRQTIFRQTMFSEFELAAYRRAERDEPLTGEALDELYLGIARTYYGHKQGVVKVNRRFGVEWSYVPHFYYNFYVFQYVTGMTAAVALAEMVRQGVAGATERYTDNLLKAGCSDVPMELLRKAGVDLSSPEPYRLAMEVFERTLDETEELVKELATSKGKAIKAKKGGGKSKLREAKKKKLAHEAKRKKGKKGKKSKKNK